MSRTGCSENYKIYSGLYQKGSKMKTFTFPCLAIVFKRNSVRTLSTLGTSIDAKSIIAVSGYWNGETWFFQWSHSPEIHRDIINGLKICFKISKSPSVPTTKSKTVSSLSGSLGGRARWEKWAIRNASNLIRSSISKKAPMDQTIEKT
jgi:hypothetical protein